MNKAQAQNSSLFLSKEGVWKFDGVEITHARTLEVLRKNLHRCEEGIYVQIGREQSWVEVEDTIYFVSSVDGTPENGFQLTLSDKTQEDLNPSSLRYKPERLVCRVKEGTEEARFLRGPYHDILQHLIEDDMGYSLQIKGEKIHLLHYPVPFPDLDKRS